MYTEEQQKKQDGAALSPAIKAVPGNKTGVVEGLELIGKQIEEDFNAVNELEERLNPILMDVSPTTEAEKDPRKISCSMDSMQQEIFCRLKRLENCIKDIQRRVCL